MVKTNIISKFKGGSMAEILLIKKDNRKYVRKIAAYTKDGLSAQKLMEQWRWLYDFNIKEPELFPETSFFVLDKNYCYYDMEFINRKTFRDVLISDNEAIDEEQLCDILYAGSIISIPALIKPPVNDSYIINKHFKKMKERNSCISTNNFYKSDTLIINGKECINMIPLLEKMKKDDEFIKLLRPKAWFRSHGDFTFQNILADKIDTNVYIIDPRGEGYDSIYYDISKLYQSCNGKYDLLYEGNYTLSFIDDSEIPDIEYKFINHEDKFNDILNKLRELIPNYYELHDENWELITKFYEASHFLSMTPFRLKENSGLTIACYAIGVQILNDVYEEWKSINGIKSDLTRV